MVDFGDARALNNLVARRGLRPNMIVHRVTKVELVDSARVYAAYGAEKATLAHKDGLECVVEEAITA